MIDLEELDKLELRGRQVAIWPDAQIRDGYFNMIKDLRPLIVAEDNRTAYAIGIVIGLGVTGIVGIIWMFCP